MNKKISTLLAAFLAAGFSYTVEAGVVKVTTAAQVGDGRVFVVGTNDYQFANGAKFLLDETSGTALKATASIANSTSIANTQKWKWVTATKSLESVANAGKFITQSGTTAGIDASVNVAAFNIYDPTAGLQTNDASTPEFAVTSAIPAFQAKSSGAAFLYVITDNVTVNANGKYITVGGKYLVKDKDGDVKLVDAITYNINGLSEVNAKWDIAGGIISLASDASNVKIEGISVNSGGAYSFTVGTTGYAIEKNTDTDTEAAKELYVNSALVSNADLTTFNFDAAPPAGPTIEGGEVAFVAGSPFLLHISGTTGFVKRAENAAAANEAVQATGATSDFYWTATAVTGQTGVYTFNNAKGRTLEVGGESQFKVVEVGSFFMLQSVNDPAKYVQYSNSAFSLTATPSYFAFNNVATTDYQAGQLVAKLGDGFNLAIKSKKGDDGVSNFKFNPFKGKLTPVKIVRNTSGVVTGFEAYKATNLTGASSYLLECADGIIVLDKSSKYPIEGIKDFADDNGGFQFKVYSKDDMKDLLNAKAGTEAYKLLQKTEYNFSISYPNSSDLSEIELIKIGNYRVISYGNDSEYYLSAGLNTNPVVGTPVYATFDGNAMVKSTDEENNPLLLGYVNLVFQSHNVKVNGNALAMAHNAAGDVIISPVEISNVVLSKPEAQWAVTANAAKVNEFTFTNRESLESVKVKNMYYMGGNKYAVAYSTINPFGYSDVARDTLVIAGAEVAHGLQMDGYANLTALNVLDNQYRLAVASTSNTDFFVTENHSGKHLLGLDKDEDAAATWKLVPLTSAREFNSFGDIRTATDSIYKVNKVGYYNAQGQYKEYTDTLAIISYALQNAKNGEYLTYQNPQTLMNLSMVCDPNSTNYSTSKDLSAAYRFVLKEKQNGLYNLVGVTKEDGATSAAAEFVMDPAHKLFGATTAESGAVEVKAMYKDINSNDLFDLQLVAAPEYRLLDRGDTIRIFRQENDYDVMFEKGEFLNIGNKAQLTTMAPALYVDTAYVKRGHNNRYQYLLVVNPTYVPELPCDIAGHPSVHPDTTYGRFLVNLVDTANVAYRKGAIHTNKYINEGEAGENFAKLGFVYGFRTGDKLYITDKNYTKSGKASDVIDLSTNNFNVAKFAFQYINPINHESDGSFKVQTGYYDYNSYIAKNEQPKVSNDGYLKNINGVVVVAKGYEAGDKFDLAIEHSNPTANDAISASEVSVVATDGAVIIKGAEGKNVVITNVLGQTIANTAISSSEATIAAPAGVVVVAVEGEAAVKAIVK